MSIKSFLRIGVDYVCFDVPDVDFMWPLGQAVYDRRYYPVNRSLVIPPYAVHGTASDRQVAPLVGEVVTCGEHVRKCQGEWRICRTFGLQEGACHNPQSP